MALDINDEEELEDQALKILETVKLKSFKVSPQTIKPFEEAQLSWEVTSQDPKFSVRLNGASVAKHASATVNPLSTKQYKIEAVAFGKSQQLGQVTLVVNHDDCLQDAIPQEDIQLIVQAQVNQLIPPGGDLTVRSPTRVTVDNGRIDIDVFLGIAVNNFFNADLDLTFKFSIGLTPDRKVLARLIDIDVDAIFAIAEHILSLGSAALIQAIVQVTVRACVKAFLGTQLESNLEAGLQNEIERRCKAAGHERILSIVANDGAVRFECCGLSQAARFTDVFQSSDLSRSRLHL